MSRNQHYVTMLPVPVFIVHINSCVSKNPPEIFWHTEEYVVSEKTTMRETDPCCPGPAIPCGQ